MKLTEKDWIILALLVVIVVQYRKNRKLKKQNDELSGAMGRLTKMKVRVKTLPDNTKKLLNGEKNVEGLGNAEATQGPKPEKPKFRSL